MKVRPDKQQISNRSSLTLKIVVGLIVVGIIALIIATILVGNIQGLNKGSFALTIISIVSSGVIGLLSLLIAFLQLHHSRSSSTSVSSQLRSSIEHPSSPSSSLQESSSPFQTSPSSTAFPQEIKNEEVHKKIEKNEHLQTSNKHNLYHVDWGEAPHGGQLYGREKDIDKLKQWIEQDRCRVVAILGSGGIGKTSLAVDLIEQLIDTFEYIFWRSLQNAPPLEGLVQDCIQLLSQDQSVLPKAANDQIADLFKCLVDHRCLIVLDNFESIMQTGDPAGHCEEGYEGYGELIKKFGETLHQSCLIITSREKPDKVALLEGESSYIRVHDLKGLETTDGWKILKDKGVNADEKTREARELIEYYAGNPLSLKVVSEFIRDVFASNIAKFLYSRNLIPADVKNILNQQFKRLSTIEQGIVYWLAIEREAVSLEELQEDIIHVMEGGELQEALKSLRRRSMIEIVGTARFTLQPMIMEYVTDKLVEVISEELSTGKITLFASHALIKAQAKDYVRDIQVRLILEPVAQRLFNTLDSKEIEKNLKKILFSLRKTSPKKPEYSAGNLLNLLIHLNTDLRGYDFSHLYVWQAYLKGVSLNQVNFSRANLERSVFTDTFTSILSVALSSDSRLLAAGTENGEVRLWAANSGAPLRVYQGHNGRVRSVVFSPDGSAIVSGSEDYTLRVWNTNTEQCLHIMKGHKDRVRSVAISPDGTIIISGSDDGTVGVWNLHTGRLINVLEGHKDRVRTVAFSLDEKTIASAGEDQIIRIWDAQSGECLKTLIGHEKQVHAVSFSPDGRLLVSGAEDQTVRIWDAQSGECLKILLAHTNQVRSVAFNPSGDVVVSSSDDTTIRLWNVQSGRCLKILEGHLHRVYSVNFSLDGSTIISGSEDQTVRLWAAFSGQPLVTLQGYINQVRSVAFHPEGSLLVSGGDDHQLRLWNVQTGQYIRTLQGHTNGIRCVAFSPDGEKIASCSDDQTIRHWNLHTGKCLKVLREHTDRVRTIAFSHNRKMLASGGEDHTVLIWETKTGQRLENLRKHTDWVRSVAFSPDDKLLVSGGEDYAVRVWSVASGECLKVLEGHKNGVRCVAFSPDGGILASSGDDETIRLWNTITWQYFKSLQKHMSWVISIAFSPNGSLLASGNEDHKVRIWDIETDQCLKILEGHEHRIYSVAFHPDGHILASGSLDGTIRLWNVDTGSCIRILRDNKPYEGMNIIGAQGLAETQAAILKDLGAIGEE